MSMCATPGCPSKTNALLLTATPPFLQVLTLWRTCWLMLLVRPDSISCLCLKTAMRAEPRQLSSSGLPSLPCVSTATSVLLPLSMLPATAGREQTKQKAMRR
jgi:hypothetical protein